MLLAVVTTIVRPSSFPVVLSVCYLKISSVFSFFSFALSTFLPLWFVAHNEARPSLHLGNRFLDPSEDQRQKFHVSEMSEVLEVEKLAK